MSSQKNATVHGLSTILCVPAALNTVSCISSLPKWLTVQPNSRLYLIRHCLLIAVSSGRNWYQFVITTGI